MSDLISRQEVEKAIKEFNKKRVDRLPKSSNLVEHIVRIGALDNILNENSEMLKIIQCIPTSYNMETVGQELEDKIKELADISSKIELSNEQKAQNYGYEVAINHAIEIVRNGGKE